MSGGLTGASVGPALDVTLPLDTGSLWSAFQETVERIPLHVAVLQGEEAFTYEQLHAAASRSASRLCGSGVSADHRVSITDEKCISLLANTLACWEVGASVLILDPELEAVEQTRRMRVADVDWEIARCKGEDGSVTRHRILQPKEISTSLSVKKVKEGGARTPGRYEPTGTASIMFTSGTTGTSKCVALRHAALLSVLRSLCVHYQMSESSRIGWTSSLGFDSAIAEPILSLIAGSTLVVPVVGDHLVGGALERFLKDGKVSHLIATPSRIRTTDPTRVSRDTAVVFVGEPLPQQVLDLWGEGRTVYNAYGPAEASICSTVTPALAVTDAINVGRPLPGVRIEIVDENRRILPPGHIGEIAISGVGVAPCYIGDDARNSSRFVALGGTGDVFFLTGDLGATDKYGTVSLRGRKDRMVKLNGRRVDLDEVESALRSYPRIADVCVVKSKDDAAKQTLKAILLLTSVDDAPTARELHAYVKELLPEFAIPTRWLIAGDFPMTSSGKVDRIRLTVGCHEELRAAHYVPPACEKERAIAVMFQEVLEVDRVGRLDSFYELGGGSLDTIRMIEGLRRSLGIDVTYESFIADPTVNGIANRSIESNRSGSSLEVRSRGGGDNHRPIASCPTTADSDVVLLTGATGFLGRCILAELVTSTDAMVICATRAKSLDQLIGSLRRFPGMAGGPARNWERRLRLVPLDLEKPDHAACTGAVIGATRAIHCASNVNVAYDFNSLFNVNVHGTSCLVEACVSEGIGRFVYISSRSAVDPVDDSGYARTKKAAEKVVMAAGSRDLDYRIIRPGRITAHSTIDYINDRDFIVRFIKSCIHCGQHPVGLESFGGTPVDEVARGVVDQLMGCGSTRGVLEPPDSELMQFDDAFSAARAAGYVIRPVSVETWLSKASEANSDTWKLFPDVVIGLQQRWAQLTNACLETSIREREKCELRTRGALSLIDSIITSLR